MTEPPTRYARAPTPRWVVALEVSIVSGVLAWVLSSRMFRGIARGFLGFGWQIVRGLAWFAPIDPAGVARTSAALLAKTVLLLAPTAFAFVRTRSHRRLWFAPLALLAVFLLPMAAVGVSTGWRWSALGVASALGLWGVRRPAWRAACVLPFALALPPLFDHSPLSDLYWTRARLTTQCASHPGTRPGGGDPRLYSARNYAITLNTEHRLLLTGERGVFELHRDDDGTMRVVRRLPFTGNLWEGCRRGDGLWVGHLHELFFVPDVPRVDPRGRVDDVVRVPLPDTYRNGREMDYLDVVCPRADGPLFVTGFLYDGLARFVPETRALQWYGLGGSYPQAIVRSDGRLVISVLNELVVFDPNAGRVVTRSLAGAANVAHDVCAVDGSVVTADALGRVRTFERTPDDHYRFVRGRDVPLPRRIAFSPDCARVAVTSANDRDVWVLRTADLAIDHTLTVGPSIRDVRYLDTGELAVVDACSVSLFR